MSDIIQLLPDSVANQIAAGEVIQRPASVIKELVENSVDAGATVIHVVVVDAGRTSIQVVDNGKGMSETDARLSFERHATSKIRQADDLFALHTMGFRGEALASIAAVAQVELKTRTSDNEIGTHLSMSGSRIVGQEAISCPVGSNFNIENLFFNVPARRKFLKSNTTELSNILTAFQRIVLVYPSIAFTLHSNGVEMLNLRAGSLRQRIVEIFGKRLDQELLPVKVDTSICKLIGFVGKPESAKKKGANQYFFVNERFMKHPYFHKAVMNAYERLVPVGMQIPYFLYIEVDPADIDVNIHPTKTEIKFENEQPIWQIIAAGVKDAIGKFCEVPSIDFDMEGKPDIPVFDPSRNFTQPATEYSPSYNPFKQGSTNPSPQADREWNELFAAAAHQSETSQSQNLFGGNEQPSHSYGVGGESSPQTEITDPTHFDGDALISQDHSQMIAEKSPAHYQYKGKYIMTAVKSGLMIIDQVRADIRIRYELYVKQMEQHTGHAQRVLFPERVQFSPSDAVILEKILPELTAMGFELSDMGKFSYAIDGVPAGTESISPVQLVTSMVADAIEKGTTSLTDLNRSLALSMARHAAITYGELLTNEEMENLVNGLFACSNVNYTPDGKAIICILPQQDIEHLLG